jgi:ribonuclease HIII
MENTLDFHLKIENYYLIYNKHIVDVCCMLYSSGLVVFRKVNFQQKLSNFFGNTHLYQKLINDFLRFESFLRHKALYYFV